MIYSLFIICLPHTFFFTSFQIIICSVEPYLPNEYNMLTMFNSTVYDTILSYVIEVIK